MGGEFGSAGDCLPLIKNKMRLLVVVVAVLAVLCRAHFGWRALSSGIANGEVTSLVYIDRTTVFAASNVGSLAIGNVSAHLMFFNATRWTTTSITDGPIDSMAYDEEQQRLYISGQIGVNGTSYIHILYVNGSTGRLGPFPLSLFTTLTYFNSSLYFVARHTTGTKLLLQWATDNSQEIRTLGSFASTDLINTIVHDRGDIYVGGSFDSVSGVSALNVARFNGTNWSAVGTGINGIVHSLTVDSNATLYAAGDFPSLNNIVKYNVSANAWTSVGNGTNGPVTSIVFMPENDALWIGGSFTSASQVNGTRHFAYWIENKWNSASSGGPQGNSTRINVLARSPFLDVDYQSVAVGGSFARLGTRNGTANVGYYATHPETPTTRRPTNATTAAPAAVESGSDLSSSEIVAIVVPLVACYLIVVLCVLFRKRFAGDKSSA